MGKVIAISNQKGGVGKSATANALYGALKRKGYKVLMIDADPQCNTTDAFKAIIENQETLYDVMKKECTFKKAIQKTETGDIVAGDPLLSRASDNFNEIGREHRIAEPIEEIKNLYDFIIIDTVPSLGIMLINSITACDGIVIPTTADRDSLQGMNDLQETISATKKYANKNLEIYGLLVTQYRKTNLGQTISETLLPEIANKMETRLFKQKIRETIKVREARANRISLYSYAPYCTAAIDYSAFTDELLSII